MLTITRHNHNYTATRVGNFDDCYYINTRAQMCRVVVAGRLDVRRDLHNEQSCTITRSHSNVVRVQVRCYYRNVKCIDALPL